MPSRELSPEEADNLWEKMDNQGYAGEMGSNKPEATRLIQEAHKVPSKGRSSQPIQPSLLPRSPLENVDSLRPDGTKKPRKSRKGLTSPNYVDQLMEKRNPGWGRR